MVSSSASRVCAASLRAILRSTASDTFCHGHPDGPPLVGNSPLYGLSDPPRSIGGEAEAAVRVELLDSPNEANVTLLDQILEGQALPTRLLGYRDNKSQVLLDESLAGGLVTLLGSSPFLALLDRSISP